jgi:PIN domain nuclease of toxin-antitoxin system
MNFLLDTHSFLWFISGDAQLSTTARTSIEDIHNDVFLSVASLWEIAIKISLGKLQLSQEYATFIPQQLTLNRIFLLDITIKHTSELITLPMHHRDPFDRLLITQSLTEGLPIIGKDSIFDNYSVTRYW